MPCSSPRTTPSRTPRRSPRRLPETDRASQRWSRSPSPPRPWRCPTTRQRSPASTTWMPRRLSQVRSSNPWLGPRRKLRLRAHLDYSALRGSTAEWQLELGGLVEREQPEPPDADWHLQVEPPAPWCRSYDDERCLGATDLGKQGAAIKSVEPSASPPPARQDQDAPDCPDRLPRARGKGDRRSTTERHDRGQSDEVRERESQTERGKQGVRRGTERSRNHGATRSLSWSSRAGPIPGTASSSSTDLNAPCFWR